MRSSCAKVPVEIGSDASETRQTRGLHRRADAALALIDRLAFERLLADLAARFSNAAPGEVAGAIDAAMRQLVQFFDYDRCSLRRIRRRRQAERGRVGRGRRRRRTSSGRSAKSAAGSSTSSPDGPWYCRRCRRACLRTRWRAAARGAALPSLDPAPRPRPHHRGAVIRWLPQGARMAERSHRALEHHRRARRERRGARAIERMRRSAFAAGCGMRTAWRA